ncbi:hypothetical protein [Leptospira vanthielii]|uniref:CDP-glycerol--glycerophosphate glycerophosphotransferase n=1 Tax=Leptospira vanthielii TaxID=293085 RepID=A0ABY2NSX4_9LEPT|nr:hypothetical protein [Leptospira vanthielii]TGM60688.1 hypothetical protein EHQ95_02080 [Leptospira vanthielii]
MKFNGRGLFVYSDPGAAKAVLSQAIKTEDVLQNVRIYSNREFGFVTQFGLKVLTHPQNIKEIFDVYKPDFVFTGTSYTTDFEMTFIEEATSRKIPSYSYVDHYLLFRKRFQINDRDCYPDEILVIDERAKQLAISEGLPADKIFIFGNPYYEYLSMYKPSISKEQFLNSIGIVDLTKHIVVFAPEPLSNINGKDRYGFDEIDVLSELKKFLDIHDFHCHLLLKPHPNQDMNKIANLLSEKFILLSSDSDTNALIYYSDIVIGFFSNFLIEAEKMNKKILRLLLFKVENDPLLELNIGKVVNLQELESELKCLN